MLIHNSFQLHVDGGPLSVVQGGPSVLCQQPPPPPGAPPGPAVEWDGWDGAAPDTATTSLTKMTRGNPGLDSVDYISEDAVSVGSWSWIEPPD